jgi:hypothetical protein
MNCFIKSIFITNKKSKPALENHSNGKIYPVLVVENQTSGIVE